MFYKYNFISILLFLSSCVQNPPPETPEIKGDFSFSGYEWNYKSTSSKVGPGPNIFSKDNVWLDTNNKLHLKISNTNGLWKCGEVVSVKTFGYGTYIFTTYSDLTTLNEKAVFGLFTWDSYSFQQQANSEVDIEFAKWNNSNDTNLLTYSVQPVWFDNAAPYSERTNKPKVPTHYLKKPCTHIFKWTPTSIRWESYEGENYPGTNKFADWYFDNSNVTRTKLEGGKVSNPIVIPEPSDSTNVRFNLWLLFGQAPSNNTETEVVIKSFKFIPL